MLASFASQGSYYKSTSYHASGLFVAAYLVALGFSVFFVTEQGGSTFIDEVFLVIFFPFSLLGLFAFLKREPGLSWLFVVYFVILTMSSVVAVLVWYAGEIPIAAPALGIGLDLKFLVFLGALIFFSRHGTRNGEEVVLFICKGIVVATLVHVPFVIRDIFSDGYSITGIGLSESPLFGYLPVGLMSHKAHTALLLAFAFSASVVLALHYFSFLSLASVLIFGFLLALTFSLKELAVLFVLPLVIMKVALEGGGRGRRARAVLLGLTLLVPVSLLMVWPYFEHLVLSRWELYIREESVRGLLYEASTQIANDYFPLGTGAGTFASGPSRSLYYSPLYHDYGLSTVHGASEDYPRYLMDTGWPKFIAEAGWIGGGAYFIAYLLVMIRMIMNILSVRAAPNIIFGFMLGILIFSTALGGSVFNMDLGIPICALFFFMYFLGGSHQCSRHQICLQGK